MLDQESLTKLIAVLSFHNFPQMTLCCVADYSALNFVQYIIYAGQADDKFPTQARNTVIISRGFPTDSIGAGVQAGWYNSREIHILLFWRSCRYLIKSNYSISNCREYQFKSGESSETF
jgi:hypothetical protein